MDDHESAAADIAGARISHGHGEAGRDRRVDRIAAALQNVGADACCQRLLRHHHAVCGSDGWRAADLRVELALAERQTMHQERQRDCADEPQRRQAEDQAPRGGRPVPTHLRSDHCAGAGVAAAGVAAPGVTVPGVTVAGVVAPVLATRT